MYHLHSPCIYLPHIYVAIFLNCSSSFICYFLIQIPPGAQRFLWVQTRRPFHCHSLEATLHPLPVTQTLHGSCSWCHTPWTASQAYRGWKSQRKTSVSLSSINNSTIETIGIVIENHEFRATQTSFCFHLSHSMGKMVIM